METFIPVTPTVFIRVDGAAFAHVRTAQQAEYRSAGFQEEWPYIPHLTIVKMGTEQQAPDAFKTASERWAQYSGAVVSCWKG